MAAVDTNIVVRLVVGDDERQERRIVAKLTEPGWVSHVILKETIWVLKKLYGLDHEALCGVLEWLLGNDVFVVAEPLVVRAALVRFEEKPTVGFHDCLALEVARARGRLPFLTQDKALAKLDGAELV